VSYQYDPDGFLTQAGALALTRDPTSGKLSGTSLGQVATTQAYNEYAELHTLSASANGSGVYSYTLDRDAAGRSAEGRRRSPERVLSMFTSTTSRDGCGA
jgi:hypothetical protein